MFLGGGEDKLRIGRRFFQGLKEGVEGSTRQHVYLIDDIHFILAYLRRDAHLFDKGAYIVNAAV